jgi:hypothetical protein
MPVNRNAFNNGNVFDDSNVDDSWFLLTGIS